MAKRTASAHNKEGRKTQSPFRRQGKVVSKKNDTKKPVRTKATKSMARIAERAYELHHQRGGHHGQDLDDWLTAEREVLSEEVC
jgi:hypothetical protein